MALGMPNVEQITKPFVEKLDEMITILRRIEEKLDARE